MARITWLGDEQCLWNEVTFQPGVPVEIADPYMIGKARTNPFFQLDEGVPRPQGTVYGIMPETWTNDANPTKRKRGRPPKVRATHVD